jgi:hypothetical protein
MHIYRAKIFSEKKLSKKVLKSVQMCRMALSLYISMVYGCTLLK